MLVTPSILVYSTQDFVDQITRLAPHYKHFQIDINDGILFPTQKTIKIEAIQEALQQFNNLTMKQLIFDFHLMAKDYKKEIKKLESLKDSLVIDTVLIHFSVLPDYQALTKNYPNFKFAVVLNPEDSIESLTQKFELSTLHGIQIMTIHPGKQGEAFMPEMLNKIEQLRLQHYRNLIYLDGAINESTLPLILAQKYAPDVIGPGSFFSHADNVEDKAKLLAGFLKIAHV